MKKRATSFKKLGGIISIHNECVECRFYNRSAEQEIYDDHIQRFHIERKPWNGLWECYRISVSGIKYNLVWAGHEAL